MTILTDGSERLSSFRTNRAWCALNKKILNWASEASPTLGCSIEISRDIYIYMLSVCRSMSVVCQINCVGGITCGPRACSKSFFGG